MVKDRGERIEGNYGIWNEATKFIIQAHHAFCVPVMKLLMSVGLWSSVLRI